MPKSVLHPALSSNKHVIGIDPAERRLGFGRFQKRCLSGEFFDTTALTEERKALFGNAEGLRLVEIYEETCRWAQACSKLPELAVIEGYSYDSEGRVFQLGEAGGVIRLALVQLEIPYIEVPPSSLKLFVTGDGDASKQHMIDAVSHIYGYETDDDNEADAIGLTMWGVVQLTKRSKRRCELQAIKNLKTPKRRKRGLKPGKDPTM